MTDIVKILNQITDSLIPDLLKSGAIDKEYNVVKPQVFLDIVERVEDEVNKQFVLVEKDGAIVNRNAASLIYSRLQILSDMKEKMAVKPYEADLRIENKEPESKKTSGFRNGILNLFRRKKTPNISEQKNSNIR